ncbi:MAG: Fur family transcriptional regulator [Chloroflexota bacterium]
MRMTPQRYGICQVLAESRTHPTAQSVFEQMQVIYPNISQATVYNTLNSLLEAGLIQGLDASGSGALHYDANPQPHVHLVCSQCQTIEDFPGLQLESVVDQISQESGYELRELRLVYFGICPRCKQEREKSHLEFIADS